MRKNPSIPFHGILAVGNSKAEAMNRYRLLALGKGATVFTDQDKSLSFVARAGSASEMFNPQTGDLDLERDDEGVKDLEFQAQAGDVETNHFECVSGCGSHILFDDQELLKFCPVCTSAVSEEDSDSDSDSDEDDIDSDSDEDSSDLEDTNVEDEDLPEDEDITSESSDVEDEDIPEDDDSDDDSDEDDSDSDSDSDESADAKSEKKVEKKDTEGSEPLVIAASSLEDAIELYRANVDGTTALAGTANVDHFVCANSDCGAHIISEESISSCPACKSSLDKEPLIVAASSLNEAIRIYKQNSITASASLSSSCNAEIEYMVCTSSECGAHILSDEVISACPACKSALSEEGCSMSADDSDSDEDFSENVDSDETAEDMPEDDAGDEDMPEDDADDMPEDDADDEDMPEDDADDEEAVASVLPVRKLIVKSALHSESNDCADDEVCDEDSDIEDAADSDSEDNDSDADAATDVNVLDNLDDSEADAHNYLDMSYSSSVCGKSMWTAFYKGLPVATARVNDLAEKNRCMFDGGELGSAIVASAKHVGVKNILKDMGFVGIKHQVSIAREVDQRVQKEVASVKTALAASHAEYQERFMAALATAAIGMNRGFFADTTNPLKAALASALTTAGVRNAETMINNAFKNSADSYHKTLFAKASEILTKPSEVQEGLAKAVLNMNYMTETSVSSNANALEDRLSDLGQTAVASTVEAAAVPTAPQGTMLNRITSAVSGLGRRRN